MVHFTTVRGNYAIIVKTMQNRQIRRFLYHARHEYLTMNNVVLAVAAVITVSFAWSSVQAIQRNYALQREVDDKHRQEQLIRLQTENLQFEQRYYKSNEYLALEAKRRLGLADSGEKVLILPPNSTAAKEADNPDRTTNANSADLPPPAPLSQWIDFLFAGSGRGGIGI